MEDQRTRENCSRCGDGHCQPAAGEGRRAALRSRPYARYEEDDRRREDRVGRKRRHQQTEEARVLDGRGEVRPLDEEERYEPGRNQQEPAPRPGKQADAARNRQPFQHARDPEVLSQRVEHLRVDAPSCSAAGCGSGLNRSATPPPAGSAQRAQRRAGPARGTSRARASGQSGASPADDREAAPGGVPRGRRWRGVTSQIEFDGLIAIEAPAASPAPAA